MVTGKVYLRAVSLSLIILLLVSCGSNTLVRLPSTPEEKQSVILSLHPGNTLQYSTNGSDVLNEGVLQEVAGDSLYIWYNDTEIGVATDGIDSLWVMQRSVVSGIKTGAIIGWSAVTGYAILGVLYLDAIGDSSGHVLFLASLASVAGAVGGGGIGACLGAAITKWERLF